MSITLRNDGVPSQPPEAFGDLGGSQSGIVPGIDEESGAAAGGGGGGDDGGYTNYMQRDSRQGFPTLSNDEGIAPPHAMQKSTSVVYGDTDGSYWRRRVSRRISRENKVFPSPITAPTPALRQQHSVHSIRIADALSANEIYSATSKLQTSIAKSGAVNSWSQLFFPFNGQHDMCDVFLNFKNTDLQSEENWVHFMSFKRLEGNMSLQLLVLVLIVAYFVTRHWFTYSIMDYSSNHCALAAIVFAIVTVVLLIWTMFLRLSLLSFTHNISVFRWLQPFTEHFYGSFYGQCLDDGPIICAALTSGLFLISQVISQYLNSITPDVIIFAFIVIIVFQMTFRGVSRIGLVCACIIMVVCINVSLELVETSNKQYIWLNGELLLLLRITYEIERQTLCQFIMSVRVLEVTEMQEKTAILLAEENDRKRLIATKSADALALTAKLLAASRETEKIAAYSAEKVLKTTVKLLSDENDKMKLVAVAEAQAASTSAVLLAAANDLHNEAAINTAKKLANTAAMMAAENEMKRRAQMAEAKVLATTAKLLAATNETKRATALVESLAKETEHIATATLLANETKNEKMKAVEEAKILATTAVLLAATNESKYAAAVHEVKMLHSTAKMLAAEYEIKRIQGEAELKVAAASTETDRVKVEQHLLRSIMGNVSHDLKTPLMSIMAEVDNLRQMLTAACKKITLSLPSVSPLACSVITPPVKQLCKDANDLLDNVNYMIQFLSMSIRRSQDFVKASSNFTLLPVIESFSLADALALVYKCIACQSSGRIIIVHSMVNICTHVISDRLYFIDSLLGLLSNAVKYSDRGAVIDVYIEIVHADPVAISPSFISTSRSFIVSTPFSSPVVMGRKTNFPSGCNSPVTVSPILSVRVVDSGIGLSADAKDSLFEPFQQAQRSAGGTGLTLYTLLKRMDALGGNCEVGNRDDGCQGSVFGFSLPYCPDPKHINSNSNVNVNFQSLISAVDVIGVEENSHGGKTNTKKSTVPPMRILLVDDAPSILKVTRRFLEAHGHTVDTAENGIEALEKLKSGRVNSDIGHATIDLMITDIQMPVMDGVECTTRFRQWESKLALNNSHEENEGSGRLIIIGMSANNDDVFARETLTMGFDSFIAKPFNYDMFMTKFLGILGNVATNPVETS